MLWILVGVLFMVWIGISKWKNRKLNTLAKILAPKSICLPIVGHAYNLIGNDEARMEGLTKLGREAYETGGIISQWQGDLFCLLVADPVIAELLLKTCLEKSELMKMFRVLLGNGSIFAPVSIWRPRRKILAPTFSQKNLNSFVEVFARQSSIMVDSVMSPAGEFSLCGSTSLPTPWTHFLAETTLGIEVNSQLEPELPFLHNFENCCRIDAKRITQPWRYNDTLNKIFYNKAFESYRRSKEFIWKFMDKIIQAKWDRLKKDKATDIENRDSNQENKTSWKTFLQLLIESSAGYDSLELREETLVLVLAGTDTSAVGAAFTMLMLARYPDVQEKVHAELQEIFGNSHRPATHEDLPRLKYLEAVIKESLRLYPPVPFITRKVEKDVKLPNGVTLVDGCTLIVCIWSIHRNPKYWGEDAELFRPERFLDTPLSHPVAFMPFSHGPRSCLGYQYAMMSMKTAISTLLRRYRVMPAETMNDKRESNEDSNKANNNPSKPNLRVKFDIMLKHVDKFELQLELRD